MTCCRNGIRTKYATQYNLPGRKYKLPNSGLLLQVLSCIIKIKRIIREKRLRGSLVVLKNTLLDCCCCQGRFIKSSQIKLILAPGIILVGFIDIGFALGAELFGYFFGKTRAALIFNISLTFVLFFWLAL